MSKDYTTLHCWEDYRQFGINPLTGESDKLCQRITCDLNEDGINLLAEFLGLHADLFKASLPENWNSGAIKSILLPRDFTALGKFILFGHCKYRFILEQPDGSLMGTNDDRYHKHNAEALAHWAEKHGDDWSEYRAPFKLMLNPIAPQDTGPLRNVHAFTGRLN